MKNRVIELPKPIEFTKERINLASYTKPELDHLISVCNFSEDELEFIMLRSKGKSNVSIYTTMCISESKLYEIRRSVESKIKKVS